MGRTRGAGNGWAVAQMRTTEAALFGPDSWLYEKAVEDGLLRVITTPDQGEGFHLSISHTKDGKPGRYPSWDEILQARDRFCPVHVEMVMYLPTAEYYVNVHPTTFHLWSVPKEGR